MAYEKMDRSFACPCGNGKMIAEWEEHDTWPSPNRDITWTFACPKCTDEYEFYSYYVPGLHTIRKADAEKHRTLVEQYRKARRKTYEAASKYEQQWVNYVLSRPSKAAIHRALASGVAYSAILRNAQRGEWLERRHEADFSLVPRSVLIGLGSKTPK